MNDTALEEAISAYLEAAINARNVANSHVERLRELVAMRTPETILQMAKAQ